MLNNGIDVLVVSRMLGHSRASVTLDIYGHLIPSSQGKAADLMEDLVTPISAVSFAPTASKKAFVKRDALSAG
jgi:integrase